MSSLAGNSGGEEPAWRCPTGWQVPPSPATPYRGGLLQDFQGMHWFRVTPQPSPAVSRGINLSKAPTAPWNYFCEQWLCLECMKMRLAAGLYPAISARDSRPVAYYSGVLRLHKYCREWLKHSQCIFSASQKGGSFLWRFLCCHF